MKNIEQKAFEIAKIIEDGKGKNTVVINVSALNSWTDYFIISTISSSVQTQGIQKQIKDYIKENDLTLHLTNKKTNDGDDWNLIDIGDIVVHLMSENARTFYELEKLWQSGEVLDFHKSSIS